LGVSLQTICATKFLRLNIKVRKWAMTGLGYGSPGRVRVEDAKLAR
jgi:hypothetical protein